MSFYTAGDLLKAGQLFGHRTRLYFACRRKSRSASIAFGGQARVDLISTLGAVPFHFPTPTHVAR
jgi:hypothetical protein